MNYLKFIKMYWILIIFTAVFACIFFNAPHIKSSKELIIYDVHTNSPRIVKDDGSIEFSDYLRIRNLSDHPHDLTGMFLSDSSKKYDKLPLDGVVIEAGGSMMIRLDPSWNFALKRSNEEKIYLSDRNGNILFIYKPSMKPDDPVISADSGFYDSEFFLGISAKKGLKIMYTLDGSEPGEDSEEYTGPIRVYDRSKEPNSVVNVPNTIENYLDKEYYENDVPVLVEQPNEEPVDKAFIIRAVAMDDHGNKSEIVTREYFFCGDKYKNIISVVADRDDLFGGYGIVSVGKDYDEWYLGGKEGDRPSPNFHKHGREWEVPADMDYFRNGKKVLSQKCGLKLQGRTTRDVRIKNFQLRARNSYSGSDVFEYDFFENEQYRSDGITLDDSVNESLFLDLIRDEPIIKQKTTDRVALFLNGEFWENIYIHQRIDEKFFEDNYGVDPDNLIVLKESFAEIGADTDEELDTVRGYYHELDSFVENNDMSVPENYNKIQTMMDMDTFVDYVALNTWIGCSDWAEYENDMCWRVKEPDGKISGDGRFRWIIHDGDATFKDMIAIKTSYFRDSSILYSGLIKNKDFRKKLAGRIIELGNTTFSDEHVAKVLDPERWDESEAQMAKEYLKNRKQVMEELADDIIRDRLIVETD